MLHNKPGNLSIPLKGLELRWSGISFAVLAAVGIVVSFQKYFKYASTGDYSIPLSLLYNLIVFSTYALFVPLIVKAVNRFPIGRQYRISNFTFHLGLSVALGLTHMIFCNLVLYGIDLSSTPIFPRFLTKYLTNVIHIQLLAYWIIVAFISRGRKTPTDARNGLLDRFVIKENGFTTFLELEKVLWIEALDHYQKLHTENGFFIYKDSMSNLTKKLPADRFKRIHRSAIINVSQVEGLKKTSTQMMVKLQNGQELAVGKSFRTEIKSLFA